MMKGRLEEGGNKYCEKGRWKGGKKRRRSNKRSRSKKNEACMESIIKENKNGVKGKEKK